MPQRVAKADRLIHNARLIIPVGFALVLAAVAAVGLLLVYSRQADEWVQHSIEVQQTAQSLLLEVHGTTIANRSYILTQDPDYLRRFTAARSAVVAMLDRFQSLTVDNQRQQQHARKLRALIGAILAKVDVADADARAGDFDAAAAVINTPEMRDLFDDIRNETDTALAQERSLLAERQDSARLWRTLLAGGVGLALLLATLLAVALAVAMQRAMTGLIDRTAELETESRLRLEAEDKLRQVQKMEAVGQLTGGIAHDFNNLLTIIIGNLDSMQRRLTKAEGSSASASDLSANLMKPLESALRGAGNAAQLTHRLLAFSRRQALEPTRIDLNRLVADMLDLLRRSLGEQINIETVLSAGLWPSFADPHQLENVLLNLALNARAAMPNGGCLTIETANAFLDKTYARQFGDVDEGQYVLLSVTDTGTGIAKDIIDRVFEPFFTTKTAGEGTGLGLPMVHGFVKQSGGHIRIYSEEGHGTAVKVYLPRLSTADEVSAVPAAKPPNVAPVPKAEPNETILLVEDNEGVRDYATRVLGELGYRVVSSGNSREALELLTRRPDIDLLFTDVVLPGAITGRVLADKAKAMRPGFPVLFTTGYTRNAIVHQGRLDPDVHLLNKPYTQQELARKVRELLDTAQLGQEFAGVELISRLSACVALCNEWICVLLPAGARTLGS